MPDTPVQAPAPPPARRLSRPALGLALLVVVLFVTSAALLITAPGPRVPRPAEANPKDQKSAQAGFLNSPPRRPVTSASPEAERIEELLRAARRPPSPGQGPLSLAPPNPDASAGPSAAPLPSPPVSGDAETPPLGAYRPYPFAPPPRPAPEAAGKPSWQAAFASSLLASPASANPASGVPQPPSFAPPPVAVSGAAPATPKGPPEPGLATPARNLLSSPGKLLTARTIPAGTVLNAILLTALSTDLPGDAVAHLTADVYASDGRLVVPRGARLIGSYKNRVALGENRLAVAWDRLLVNGRSYDLPGLPSTSPDGAAGLPGEVNHHTGLVFGRAALLSLIGAGAQLGQTRQSRLGATLSNGEVATGSVAQQLSQAATEYLNRAVNVTPTIFIPAGARLTVLLPYDLELN